MLPFTNTKIPAHAENTSNEMRLASFLVGETLFRLHSRFRGAHCVAMFGSHRGSWSRIANVGVAKHEIEKTNEQKVNEHEQRTGTRTGNVRRIACVKSL